MFGISVIIGSANKSKIGKTELTDTNAARCYLKLINFKPTYSNEGKFIVAD